MFNIGDKVKVARIDDLVQQGSFEVVDSYLGKTGTITDSQESTYGVMYEITFDEEVEYDGLFFSETELELVDENDEVLVVGNLKFYNYVDKDGDIKLDTDDVYGDCTYINVYDLDRIINFLTNIKNREFRRMGK